MRLGIHMPQKGGFAAEAERAASIGCRTVQIFPGNPTGWKMGRLDEAEGDRRAALLEACDLHPLVVHCAYLVNLAASSDEVYTRSKLLLTETMARAALYRAPYVVLHSGNHTGLGPERGLTRVIEAVGEGLKAWPLEVKLLLENTAGSGTALGANFADLSTILKAFPAGRLGVCLDTAHAWAAGYDLGSAEGVRESLAALDGAVGLENLHVIHVNDTKVKRGARVDRHAHIGEGAIGLEGFAALLNRPWPEDLPVILETPETGTARDRENLQKLESLLPAG